MKIANAPLKAISSKSFYREVARTPLSKGFVYLLYLSLFGSLMLHLFFHTHLRPEMRAFHLWLEDELPKMQIASSGLQMDEPSPFLMVHPKFGPTVTFDLRVDAINPAEFVGGAPVLITRAKVYVRRPDADPMTFDLPIPSGKAINQPIPLNPNVGKLFGLADLLAFSFIPLAVPLFFMALLLIALPYSLLGLLINLLRTRRLNYSSILNVTFFALTASFFVSFFFFLFIPFREYRFEMWLGMMLTASYLFLGVKLAEEPGAAPQEKKSKTRPK